MKIETKIKWLRDWCAKEGLVLITEGECGFGRKCVGVASKEDQTYPDYEWYDKDYTKRIDNNGEVWCPEGAYHKHPCTAVLGRGASAIDQLYQWCRWFEKNGFSYKSVERECEGAFDLIMGRNWHHQMVRG